MAEKLTLTPPASVTHPPAPVKIGAPVIQSARFSFAIDDSDKAKPKIVVQLSDTARLEMTPTGALGIAALLVRHAMKAAPSTFGDERTTLARMLREASALATPPAEVG